MPSCGRGSLVVGIKGRDIDLGEIATPKRPGGAQARRPYRRSETSREAAGRGKKAKLVESVFGRGAKCSRRLVLPVRRITTADAKEEEEEEEKQFGSQETIRDIEQSASFHIDLGRSISQRRDSSSEAHHRYCHGRLFGRRVDGSNILREEMCRVDAERKKQRSDESKARLMNIVSKRCRPSRVSDRHAGRLHARDDDEVTRETLQDAADALHPLHAYAI